MANIVQQFLARVITFLITEMLQSQDQILRRLDYVNRTKSIAQYFTLITKVLIVSWNWEIVGFRISVKFKKSTKMGLFDKNKSKTHPPISPTSSNSLTSIGRSTNQSIWRDSSPVRGTPTVNREMHQCEYSWIGKRSTGKWSKPSRQKLSESMFAGSI
jgi:hypothetical protein